MKTVAEQFRDWEGEAFGFGYGTGEGFILPKLRRFLDLCNESDCCAYSHEVLERELSPAVAWLLINVLCKMDAIEYGTSPRHGWLTDKGRRLKDFVLSMSADDLENVVLDYDLEQYVHCYKDACNCGLNGYEVGRRCENQFWT